jgi:hypothetical protein
MEMSHEQQTVLAAIRQEKRIDKARLEVRVHTPTGILTGNVHCLPRQRLLDLLNSVLVGGLRAYFDFLPLTEVTIYSPNGTEATTETALVNKDNILFVIEVGQTSGIGGERAYRSLPLVGKPPLVANLYVPSYKLSGKMHSTKGQRLSDLLNTGDRFLAVTNVQIVDSSGNSQEAAFVAINKAQIIYSEEISH